jgi:hypothetical protein
MKRKYRETNESERKSNVLRVFQFERRAALLEFQRRVKKWLCDLFPVALSDLIWEYHVGTDGLREFTVALSPELRRAYHELPPSGQIPALREWEPGEETLHLLHYTEKLHFMRDHEWRLTSWRTGSATQKHVCVRPCWHPRYEIAISSATNQILGHCSGSTGKEEKHDHKLYCLHRCSQEEFQAKSRGQEFLYSSHQVQFPEESPLPSINRYYVAFFHSFLLLWIRPPVGLLRLYRMDKCVPTTLVHERHLGEKSEVRLLEDSFEFIQSEEKLFTSLEYFPEEDRQNPQVPKVSFVQGFST